MEDRVGEDFTDKVWSCALVSYYKYLYVGYSRLLAIVLSRRCKKKCRSFPSPPHLLRPNVVVMSFWICVTTCIDNCIQWVQAQNIVNVQNWERIESHFELPNCGFSSDFSFTDPQATNISCSPLLGIGFRIFNQSTGWGQPLVCSCARVDWNGQSDLCMVSCCVCF